jgi:flagellar basal body rod protein FlgF
MDHKCDQADRIKNIEKTLFDNGQKGLKTQVTEINVQMKYFNENIKSFSTSMSGMIKFMTETQTKEKQRQQMNKKINVLIGIIVTMFVSYIGIIVKLFA